VLLIVCTIITNEQLCRPIKQDDTDELSGDSSPSLQREAKGWWRASEPPEEWFSDIDDEEQEWRYQIIGEDVDGSGKVWCLSSIPLLLSISF
jgi:hypothetical protein